MAGDLINQHDDIDDDLICQAIIESGLGLTQIILEGGTHLGNIFSLTKLSELSYQDINLCTKFKSD